MQDVAASKRWKPWMTPVAVTLAVLAVQLATIGFYGATWDEPLHRNWAKLFLLYWQTGDKQYLVQMPGMGMYYDQAYFVLNYWVAQFASHTLGMPFAASNHLLQVIVTSASAGVLFLFIRSAFGGRIAWLTLGFTVLYPQLAAHAQYNPKDVPVLAATLWVMAAAWKLFETKSKRWAVITGIVYGLALAAKLSAVALLPIFAVLAAMSVWKDAGDGRARQAGRLAILTAIAAVASAIVLFMAWPVLWREPLLVIDSLKVFLTQSFWPGRVLYFGTEYSGAELPWHYIPFTFFLATPFLTFVAFLGGSFIAAKKILRSREGWQAHLVVLAWFWIPLLLTLKPGLVRYDGIRQFLFIIPALTVLAAVGLDAAIARLKTVPRLKHVTAVACVIVFGWLARETAYIFPFGGSYVSEPVRAAIPKDINDTFEVEIWGASYRQAHDWIIANVKPGEIVCVPIGDYLVTWYEWPDWVRFGCTDTAKYVMFFSRYSKAYRKKFETLAPAFSIERYNTPLLLIYDVSH